MSRKRKAPKRKNYSDPKYRSQTVSKFINSIMYDGERSTAEKILYTALEKVKSKNADPLKVFNSAVNNVRPNLEVRSRRVGGATYQVPMEVRQERGTAMALRWLVTFSRARNGKSMSQKLAGELMDAANETGSSVKKREDTHKMAEANKAFAHYRY